MKEELANKINEQISNSLAEVTLSEREQVQRQAEKWKKQGADEPLVEQWTTIELKKIEVKKADMVLGLCIGIGIVIIVFYFIFF